MPISRPPALDLALIQRLLPALLAVRKQYRAPLPPVEPTFWSDAAFNDAQGTTGVDDVQLGAFAPRPIVAAPNPGVAGPIRRIPALQRAVAGKNQGRGVYIDARGRPTFKATGPQIAPRRLTPGILAGRGRFQPY